MQCMCTCWRSAERVLVPGVCLLRLWGPGRGRGLWGLQTRSPRCVWPSSNSITRELGKVTAVRPCPSPEAERSMARHVRTWEALIRVG